MSKRRDVNSYCFHDTYIWVTCLRMLGIPISEPPTEW
jgi:hypothetical protein